MSLYLMCPLCGKLAHLSCFTPDEYSEDIECVEMRSLGRARGFEVSARFSALGDEELMDMIASRCRAILKIVGEEVTEKSSVAALKKKLGEWRNEALGLRDEIVELQKSLDDFEEEFDELLERANVVLTEIYEEPFSTLDAALKALITECREAMEELEDYEIEEAEDEDEDDDEDHAPPMTELDRELQIG